MMYAAMFRTDQSKHMLVLICLLSFMSLVVMCVVTGYNSFAQSVFVWVLVLFVLLARDEVLLFTNKQSCQRHVRAIQCLLYACVNGRVRQRL